MCPKKTCSHARVPPSGGGGISAIWDGGISEATGNVLLDGAGVGDVLKRTEVESDEESQANEDGCTICFSGSIMVGKCDLYDFLGICVVYLLPQALRGSSERSEAGKKIN